MKNILRNWRTYLLAALAVCAALLGVYLADEIKHEKFFAVFLSVGQGDAAFINVPGGAQVLLDTGPDRDILAKLNRHMPLFDKTIEAIILSHYDADHMRGALSILKRYNVESVYGLPGKENTPEYAALEKLIAENGAQFVPVSSGKRIVLDGATFIDLFLPTDSLAGDSNFSMIAKMVHGENSFLFAGDADMAAERALIAKGYNLDSDVLKVGHHGSKYSTSVEFLKNVTPQYAVISAGKNNRYGHPHQETLERLLESTILRTDMLGDIMMTSDGKQVFIK